MRMQSVQTVCYVIVKQKSPNNNTRWQGNFGGAGRSRTDLLGFAIRYITALLPRPIFRFIFHTLQPKRAAF